MPGQIHGVSYLIGLGPGIFLSSAGDSNVQRDFRIHRTIILNRRVYQNHLENQTTDHWAPPPQLLN